MKSKIVIISFFLSFMSGCASFSHYNEAYHLDSGKAVLMDAKQRGVYTYRKSYSDSENDEAKKIYDGFCAEPSPDAVSAMAATLGLDLALTDKGKLGFSNAISEGVSNIGLRTTAIQALRDIMYRNCEAYAGGGIGQFGLETLQRRFQSTMVAIIAIEQLTSAVRVPNTVIVSKTQSGSPDAIVELTNKAELARVALKNAQDEEKKVKEKESTAKSALDSENDTLTKLKEELKVLEGASPKDEAKIAGKKTEVDNSSKIVVEKTKAYEENSNLLKLAEQKTKDSQQAYAAIDASRVAALTGGGSASTNAVAIETEKPNVLSDEAVENISSTVLSIVESTNGLSHTKEVCTTIIGQNSTKKPEEGSPLSMCLALLASAGDKDKTEKVIDSALKNFSNVVTDNPAVAGWLPKEGKAVTVISLQKLINELMHKGSSSKLLKEDGIFGNATKSAIEKIYAKCKGSIKSTRPHIDEEAVSDIYEYAMKAKDNRCMSSKTNGTNNGG